MGPDHGIWGWRSRIDRTKLKPVKCPGSEFHYPGDDLVGILSQLTQEVERLDSIIQSQRYLIQLDGADMGPFHDRLMHRQSKRIRAGAADMATRALSALEQLRNSGYAGATGARKPD
jgi:hypothetical protein